MPVPPAAKARTIASEFRSTVKKFSLLAAKTLAGVGATLLLAPSLAAQSLSASTLTLYPREAGELAFANLRALRQSPHYPQLRAQFLPERLKDLENYAKGLGIDFETQGRQLSWAFVVGKPEDEVDLVSVAEGDFNPAVVLEQAKARNLATSQASGQTLITAGKNERGKEFVLTLPDPATLLFGSRAAVEAMLARRAEGRGGSFDNAVLSPLITEVNGRSPVWLVMDQHFAALGFKQLAPTIAARPEAAVLLGKLKAGMAEVTLTRDLAARASLFCSGASEAQLLAAILQAAISLSAVQASATNPELATVLRSASIDIQGDRVEAKLTLPETEVAALLQRNVLKF